MQVIKDTKSKVDKSLESLYMTAVEQDIKMNNAYKDIKMKIRDEIGIQNVKLIEKEYEYFDQILSEMSVKNDNRYLLFYELLELCKNKKRGIRIDPDNRLNWQIYNKNDGNELFTTRVSRKKIEVLYDGNVIQLNSPKLLKMII